MTNKITLKERLHEFIENRWIYCISILFNFIIPAILIAVKTFSIKTEALNPRVSVSFGGMIAGLIYLGFISKKLKAKIDTMEHGAVKIFVRGIQSIIPFIVTAFIFYVIEKALEGASVVIWAIVISLFIGIIFQVIDWEINKEYLYKREIDKLAKKQADIEIRKTELIEQSRQHASGEDL